MGYEDDLNLYAYVRNDPLNNTDPTGLDACPDTRNCWRADNFDASSAPTQRTVQSDAAVDTHVTGERGDFRIRDQQEQRSTNEKLSVVREGGEGQLRTERVTDASASNRGDTTTTSGRTDMTGVRAVVHGHANEGGTVAPGPRDDNPVRVQGVPNFIVQNGRVGVVEMVGGRFQFRLLSGRLERQQGLTGGVDERGIVQNMLDEFQGRVQ